VSSRPTERTYWLIVARNVDTGEVKYFVSVRLRACEFLARFFKKRAL
jgi:hypothetical protein